MRQGIYCIIINKKRYVGSSIEMDKRLIQHKSNLKCNRHCNPYLQNAYNKYKQFKIKILEENENLSNKQLRKREKYYIKLLKSEYNIQDPETNFNSKPIYQFDKNGVLIKKYSSSPRAASELGISTSSIRHAAQPKERETLTAGGFLWSYSNKATIRTDKRVKVIYVFDLSGVYIKEYVSVAECAMDMFPNITRKGGVSSISKVATGKRPYLNGYIFSYNKNFKLNAN